MLFSLIHRTWLHIRVDECHIEILTCCEVLQMKIDIIV